MAKTGRPTGVRRQNFHPDWVRQKIRAAHLVRRLHRHIDGKIELSATQIRAIDILLRKIVPDLVQTSVTAELTHKYVVEVPPLLTRDEWSKKYRAPPPKPLPSPTLDLEPVPTLPLITTIKQ